MTELKKWKLLYSAETIAARVSELADEIQTDVRRGRPIGRPAFTDNVPDNAELVCVCVLKGAFMFFSDLVKHLKDNVTLAFIRLSSYGDKTKSGGQIKNLGAFTENVKGKNVLIVEDIADSGRTLKYLTDHLKSLGAATVRSVCLLDKPCSREIEIKPDYAAFTIPTNQFIVGYGMDYAEHHRNLDALYILEE
jgi:hypoxanthine phosphoribosyltransferase